MNYRNMGSEGREVQPSTSWAAAPLARQSSSSIYALTLDEFQTTMGAFGKDFGSMNMDEFLKSVWTAEESQAMASAFAAASAAAQGGDLQRQGSLTLPRTLSQKTVDEVWRDLVVAPGPTATQQFQQQRQPTLGEMTLEEFLVRAGVVREDMNMNQNQSGPLINNNISTSLFGKLSASTNHPGLSLGFPQPGLNDGTLVPNPIPNNSVANLALAAAPVIPYAIAGGGGAMRIGDPAINSELMSGMVCLGGPRVTVSTVGSPANPSNNGDLSSLSPVPYVFSGGLKRRKCGGVVEKVVERRQRRMIKNRESAARSRARKHAYTMELEAEVAKLKDQNQELLRKQAEIMKMQKNQILELINQQRGPKKQCLRRTQTGPW